MEHKDVYAEISSIKNMMERSTKFISLSGLSGVMAGIYALIGAAIGYKLLYGDFDPYVRDYNEWLTWQLLAVACGVLVLSVGTGLLLTVRKARRKRQTIWNPTSRALLVSGSLPLFTGGAFAMILIWQGHYGVIAATCLIFYGLALVAASQHTFGDVKWLGICDIILGLIAAAMPGFGLMFWAMGFGVLHIVYGTIMHFKYDRENIA
ncbi:hypothetical protein KHS38_02270 [Mucilaginibacter sp. Bleaf8]|uniref:hypothetical protein n=1 Tax=Mucilaginibacter sp. Bleaf8 TaxID=2834430 RepID=UPI001BD0103D|nr:hypothetical protein [Mucilaginibacter sp. Bleaf8]MBS7563218.1 hypothetical protein [Mucilaginibacter sp. Bleaf8]